MTRYSVRTVHKSGHTHICVQSAETPEEARRLALADCGLETLYDVKSQAVYPLNVPREG